MARTVRDANLETRTARHRLPIRSEPYWRGLEKGFALGYRRRGSGGTCLARRRQADGGYAEHRIGTTEARAEVTVASLLNELEDARKLAEKINQPSAAVAATLGKAKVAGLIVDRKE